MNSVEESKDVSIDKKRDWVEVGLKIFTPIITGLLIAWAGFVGNYTLTDISNKEQSARLITELQISREKAESDLRKDVFDQALQAFLLKGQQPDNSLYGMSKQLLRLELLSLNFGDSLSLSPLFTEYREDLKRLKPQNHEVQIFAESIGDLRKRLFSLARRVSSAQVSSLEQHGQSKIISIPLDEYKNNRALGCDQVLYEGGYAWPAKALQLDFGIDADSDGKILNEEEIGTLKYAYVETLQKTSSIMLDGIERFIEVNVSDVDHCEKSIKVTVDVRKNTEQQPDYSSTVMTLGDLAAIANDTKYSEVHRRFNLDYFNFPMVDNTRLSDSHRFSIVLEEFDLKTEDPYIELVVLIFPAEYASLRDRPGMQEARKLLEDALHRDENKERK